MKKYLAIILLSIIGMACFGQEHPTGSVKGNKVIHVKDWGSKILIFKKGFWDLFKDTVIMQVGAEEFEKIKWFAATEHIPFQLTLFNGLKSGNLKEFEALYRKMDGLTVYKVATITYTKQAGFKPHAILSVPYSENKNWDKEVKWDMVYFVIPDENVELEN